MENDKIEPRTLTGFMELLPSNQVKFNQLIDKIRKSYEKFGFMPIDTPIIELAEVLLAKAGGETEKQIYRFNKGENDLALRFDLTVPLAKYVAMNYNNLAFPFRRYQIGKVYRGERPQKGRFREFYQCDIDIIGDNELNLLNDAEIPSIIYNTFKELELGDFTICINNRKILNGLFKSFNIDNMCIEIMRIIDKIEKIGKEAVIQELEKIGIQNNIIEQIIKFILIDGTTDEKIQQLKEMKITEELYNIGIKELEEVVKNIRDFGVPDKNFTVDLTIARGLDYYTGTVYETFLNNYKQIGSICSGGRYDNLAEFYTNKKLPGVGISIGLTRLFYQLNELNIIKQNQNSIAKVLVISMTQDISDVIKIANTLRNAGINTEIYKEYKKIKTKFKYADKLQIPYVIVIGEEEILNQTISLKNMQTGEQESLKIEDVVEKLQKYLQNI